MREIKFRAWDPLNQKMHQMQFALYENERYATASGEKPLRFRSMNLDALTVIQFTGLHDKNGKEIYEGDVCKGTVYEDMEVRWGKDGWVLRRRGEDLFPLGAIQQQFTEVIGNVFENPELLATPTN